MTAQSLRNGCALAAKSQRSATQCNATQRSAAQRSAAQTQRNHSANIAQRKRSVDSVKIQRNRREKMQRSAAQTQRSAKTSKMQRKHNANTAQAQRKHIVNLVQRRIWIGIKHSDCIANKYYGDCRRLQKCDRKGTSTVLKKAIAPAKRQIYISNNTKITESLIHIDEIWVYHHAGNTLLCASPQDAFHEILFGIQRAQHYH
jgi:multidrug efflux pump subunit AcrA (membrane-fusion protein)